MNDAGHAHTWPLRNAVFGQLAITAILFWIAGATAEKDLFDAAATIPWFLLLVAAGPHIGRSVERLVSHADGDPWEARRTSTAALRGILVGYAFLTIVGIATSPWLAEVLFPAIGSSDRLAGLLRVLLFGHFLLGVTLVLEKATRTRWARTCGWIGAIGHVAGAATAALLFGADVRVEDLAWGSLAGTGAAVVFVAWVVDRHGLGFEWTTPWLHRSMRTFAGYVLPGTLSAMLLAVETTLPALGGQFAGEGSVAALVGVRWLVIAAAWAALGDRSRGGDRALVPTGAVIRAGLALGLLVGLAPATVETLFGWGQMDAAATDTISLLLVIAAVGTPFALVARSVRPAGSSRLTIVLLGSVALATVPLTVGAGRVWGSSAVDASWVVHVIAVSAVLVVRAPSIDRVRPRPSDLMVSAAGGLAAMAAALMLAWLGGRLGAPAPITLIAGGAGAVAAWLFVSRRLA